MPSFFEAMKNIADKFMISQLTRIRKPLAIDHVIPEIIKHGGTIKIDDLVKTAYMSNRQFERAFKDSIVFRQNSTAGWFVLEKAWLLNENNPTMTWTQVAYECNYFDPLYLIRDFKVFAGTNPKEISVALKASLSYS